jgi:hypothetical protein
VVQITTLQAATAPTRWKRVSKLGHPIYPFLNQNLFFFRRVSHSPPAAPQHTTQPTAGKRGGGVGNANTFGCYGWIDGSLILILIRNCPLLAPLPRCPFLTGRSDLSNAHTGRQGILSHLVATIEWLLPGTPPMDVTGECVCGTPALIHQEFRFTACNSHAASDSKSLVCIYVLCIIFFAPYHQVNLHVSLLYISRHFHPGSSRFDQ